VAVDERELARSLQELTYAVGGPAAALSDQLGVVVSVAVELLGVDCVGVLLLDDADDVRTVAASGPAAAALETAQEQLQLGPGVDVLGTGRVLAIVDLATDPQYWQLWPQLADVGVRGVLAAPVVVRGEVVGTMTAVTGQRHRWSEAECRAAGTIAALIGQLLLTAASSAGSVSPRAHRPKVGSGDGGTGHVTVVVDPEALGASFRQREQRRETAVHGLAGECR
jgi:transcriptional regulator with GAF, ATPase, and Fis domain